MASARATIAQLDAVVSRDPSRGTPAQCRAFDAVFAFAMEGKPVDVELLAIALAMPTKRVDGVKQVAPRETTAAAPTGRG